MEHRSSGRQGLGPPSRGARSLLGPQPLAGTWKWGDGKELEQGIVLIRKPPAGARAVSVNPGSGLRAGMLSKLELVRLL